MTAPSLRRSPETVVPSGDRPRRAHRVGQAVRSTSWVSVLAVAVLVSAVDGFAMISLRQAVGFIGRAQNPFDVWVLHSTLQLPLFVLAVWGGFLLARRRRSGWTGRHPQLVTIGVTAITTTLAGVILTAANAAYDYELQLKEMAIMMRSMPAMSTGMEEMMQGGIDAHLYSILLISGVLLVANLVVTAWVAVMRGGRLVR